MLVAIVITVFKFIVGILSGSLGILSEALHSSLDLVAAIVTLFAVRVSDLPADADYQYGHGKIENVSAFIETGLLFLTCIWIVYEAVHRLFFHNVEIEPSVWAVLVMASPSCSTTGARARSSAWPTSMAARPCRPTPCTSPPTSGPLRSSSPVSASSGPDASTTFPGWPRPIPSPPSGSRPSSSPSAGGWPVRPLDALLDAAPTGVRNEIIAQVGKVPGVLGVERVRIRKAGSRYFTDVAVGMARSLTFQASDAVVSDVRQRIQGLLGDSDVLVTAVPRELVTESTFDRIRAAALRNNLMVHDISVQDLDGDIHVELHLELDEKMTLIAAHDRVTALEADIRAHVPEITSILTHIESEPATIETSEAILQDHALEAKLISIGAALPDVVDVHEIIFKRVRGHIFLSCHVTMQDNLPLARVHDVHDRDGKALQTRGAATAPRPHPPRAANRQPPLAFALAFAVLFLLLLLFLRCHPERSEGPLTTAQRSRGGWPIQAFFWA